MVWRETFPPTNEPALDAEVERERRLAAQARAGADWALTALIARYQPTVTRYLTRLCGDQSRARELAERVFQRMERRLHGPHGADNLRLWLLRASTEAGLEALRRPRRAQAPRLGATPVAGLLPAETGSGPQNALRGGISRLRNVVGVMSRQARPLVWQGADAAPRPAAASPAERAREAIEPGPLDEALDTLDPREALRHRLVRLTLADLPYGDAQCLALHLVAGLNQAEVARALGITGSAARKRIVQGLAQFSERYQAAVRSLGLPEELGYGPAAPQQELSEILADPKPEPEPMIVPETPEEMIDMVDEVGAPAPSTIPLAVDSFDDNGETLSGVAYYTDEPLEGAPAYHSQLQQEYFTPEDEVEFDAPIAGFAAANGAPDASAFTSAHTSSPHAEVTLDEPEAPFPAEHAEVADAGETHAPFAGAGSVTRIAADAIVGPVVDALPVHSEPLAMAPGFGSPNPRSTPLAYELASGDAEPGGITMNWMDSTGMLAPLSFEAIAAPASMDAEPVGGDDPWERSTILELETPLAPEPASALAADPEERSADDEFAAEIAMETLDTSSSPPPDLSIALDEGDYGWERSYPSASASERGAESLDYEEFPLAGQAHGPFFDEPEPNRASERPDTSARPAPPVTRTLEDLWDETPDTFGR